MAAVQTNDIFQVTLVGLIHGQTTMTTFYYRVGDVGAGLDLDQAYALTEAYLVAAGNLSSLFRGCCPTNWTLTAHWIQDIHPIRYRKEVFTKSLAGLSTAASPVTNVAASITRVGELSGRNRVGGIRVPIAPSLVTNGVIAAGQLLTDLNALANEMKVGFGGGQDPTFSPGFICFVPGQQPNQKVLSFNFNFDCFVQTTSRVVRRRTVGLGI